MKTIIILFLLFINSAAAQQLHEETKELSDTRMQWWREARFGMFIHWGLYSIAAGEWNGEYTTTTGEWIMDGLKIPVSEYEKLAPQFNPVKFNADEWVKTAKDAGMKYLVVTSKHHDGFCLFPSKDTEWDITATPFKRDPLKELAESCKKFGIKLCFYYSIMDWHHPLYPDPRPWNDKASKVSDMNKYVEYMKGHIKELLTNYGPIGILWFDGEWEDSWTNERAEDLMQYIRELQPDIIINNRIGKARSSNNLPGQKVLGDYGTPEQEIPSTGLPGIDWETCMTMNDTWGFRKDDNNWKSSDTLIYNLIDIASKGGNFLLNVGPTAEGLIPDASTERLKDIGRWMEINGESIYGTGASPFSESAWGKCTQKTIKGGTRLYLHILNYPDDRRLVLHGLMNKPVKAYLLADKEQSALPVTSEDAPVTISLPAPSERYNNVIVLDIEGKPEVLNSPLINSSSNIFIDSLIINIPAAYEGTEIRYTLDGSKPVKESALVSGPIILKDNSIVSAMYFRNGEPSSDVRITEFRKVYPLPAVQIKNPAGGVRYKYFEGEWSELPDFNSLKINKEGVLPGFTLEQAEKTENYAYEFYGYINIPEDGIYTFYLASDDGSRLYINDVVIVNNDGLHGMIELSGETALQKGFHSIRAAYFQGGGGAGLNISFSSTGKEKIKIPVSSLFYNE